MRCVSPALHLDRLSTPQAQHASRCNVRARVQSSRQRARAIYGVSMLGATGGLEDEYTDISEAPQGDASKRRPDNHMSNTFCKRPPPHHPRRRLSGRVRAYDSAPL